MTKVEKHLSSENDGCCLSSVRKDTRQGGEKEEDGKGWRERVVKGIGKDEEDEEEEIMLCYRDREFIKRCLAVGR